MEFVPDSDSVEIPVPFYGDVMGKSREGWSGHTSKTTVEGFKSQIAAALARLGGMVSGFQPGKINDEKSGLERQAMRIHYNIENGTGELWPGQIDIAALPVNRKKCRDNSSYENKKNKSMVMALSMTLVGLKGAWNMKVLSPGYAPLIPWMIAPGSKTTLSQDFMKSFNSGSMDKLLPPPVIVEEEVVEGEFTEE